MSTERHEDALLEVKTLVAVKALTPRFPEGIDELNLAYGNVSTNGVELKVIGKSIKGFMKMVRLTTNDGYCWFWALVFRRGLFGRITVTFPWSQDWNCTDDVQSDRSIAFYVLRSRISNNELQKLTRQLAIALQELPTWRRRASLHK